MSTPDWRMSAPYSGSERDAPRHPQSARKFGSHTWVAPWLGALQVSVRKGAEHHSIIITCVKFVANAFKKKSVQGKRMHALCDHKMIAMFCDVSSFCLTVHSRPVLASAASRC